MARFMRTRLDNSVMHLDIDGLRRGLYSDKYLANVVQILRTATDQGYQFAGEPRPNDTLGTTAFPVGDAVVEAQIFHRRQPWAVVGGVDAALTMLRHASGYFQGDTFVETWRALEVQAVEDGALVRYGGDPSAVTPVLRIRGRYRDFALLETAMLGVLTRISRMATNVYALMQAAGGKPLLFFPARYDLPDVQAADGYAYWLGIQRYNMDYQTDKQPFISTDAQGLWWGGSGGGTIPHALIAAFLGDSSEAMIRFAETLPPDVPRILLADFHNDCIADALQTLRAFWPRYRAAYEAGDAEGQRRWTLHAVRLDTAGNMVDAALPPASEGGVSPMLVRAVRSALDSAWESLGESGATAQLAQAYCQRVQIVVTGGFSLDKVRRFEQEQVPVDVYGVGSALMHNGGASTTDFTMDVVRVRVNGQWVSAAKQGRQPGENTDLKPVDLGAL